MHSCQFMSSLCCFPCIAVALLLFFTSFALCSAMDDVQAFEGVCYIPLKFISDKDRN